MKIKRAEAVPIYGNRVAYGLRKRRQRHERRERTESVPGLESVAGDDGVSFGTTTLGNLCQSWLNKKAYIK